MGCEKYRDRVGEFAASAKPDAHFDECPDCAERLRRARRIAQTVSNLPRVSLPEERATAILYRARSSSGGTLRRLVRVAAAVLIVAGGVGIASVLSNGSDYQPLDVRVIDVDANGTHDEDLAFDHIFGPERASLVATGGTDRR